MPLSSPPASATVTPHRIRVPAGAHLWRVHRKHRTAADFKSVESDAVFGGGRFDSTADDRYSYLYAAHEPHTALLETLVRGIPFNDAGSRLIRRAAIADYRISALEPTRDLVLISLFSTADLAAVCQDGWLIHSPPSDYPQTRRWGHWLRSQAAWAQGLAWPSGRDIGRQAVILFGDRCRDGALCPVQRTEQDLDDAAGARWLNEQLAPYRISVRLPARRSAGDYFK